MEFSTKLLILVFALWALYLLARRMRLGQPDVIVSDDHARQIADEHLYGFDGGDVAIAADRQSALVQGPGNAFAIIRSHGAHFIVRKASGAGILQHQTALQQPGKSGKKR